MNIPNILEKLPQFLHGFRLSQLHLSLHVIPDNDQSSVGTVPSAAILFALLVAEHSFLDSGCMFVVVVMLKNKSVTNQLPSW